jgi:hypothetical protein
MVNPAVYYAYEIGVYPQKMTMEDSNILHLTGVLWSDLNSGAYKSADGKTPSSPVQGRSLP